MRRSILCTSLFSIFAATAACSAGAPDDGEDDLASAEGELSGLAQGDVVATIHYGESTQVASSATRRYRAVQFAGAKGDAVDFWVRSSADARAWLIAPDFKKTIASNDDGSSATKDAHVTATLPSSGTYTVVFREKHSVTTTFDVSLAGTTSPPPPPPPPSSLKDPCVKHPWPMAYGCRDHQGRSTAVGPTKPTIAWQADLPLKARVDRLLADANGTVYAIQGSSITAVAADGKIAWRTGAYGYVADVAIGGDDALYVYEQATIGANKHTLARFAPADGKRTQIFTEGLGSTYLPRVVTPLPDGRVHFGVAKELASRAASEQVTPSTKIYDPSTQTLVDAPTRYSFFRGADLPGGGFFTSEYAHVMQGGNPTTIFWLDRHAPSGAVVTHTEGAQLWGVAPGGTVYGVKTDPLGGTFGWPSIVRSDGTLQVLTQNKAGTIPFTFAITSDDALVYGGQGAVHAPNAAPPPVIGKYTKTGAKVFETEVRVEGGNIAVDAKGNIYAGGQGFSPSGASLFAGWSLGYWLPENGLVALGPNRTLYSTYTLSTADGRIYALRDATP